MNKIISLILVCWLMAFAAYSQQVYKVIKPDGTVVYTDQPQQGATAINLGNLNSVAMPVNRLPAPAATPGKPAIPNYRINIVQPTEKQTVRNNLGEVSIQVQVQPQKPVVLELLLDNQPVKSQTDLQFVLHNIPRGEHHLQVNILGQSGKVIASSPVRTFYLHHASALIKAKP